MMWTVIDEVAYVTYYILHDLYHKCVFQFIVSTEHLVESECNL